MDDIAPSAAPADASPPTPGWVKGLGIVAVVLILLFVGLHLTGNMPTHAPTSSGPDYTRQTP
ncbi:MAG: hypothetical protein NVSMB2_28250 [Chloroflexota bacterium]